MVKVKTKVNFIYKFLSINIIIIFFYYLVDSNRGLDVIKLFEIYKCIELKYQDFYNSNKAKNKYRSMINDGLNSKLGNLNRYFQQLKRNFELEDESKTYKYSLTKDDKLLLRDLKEYEENPTLFNELDLQIDNTENNPNESLSD